MCPLVLAQKPRAYPSGRTHPPAIHPHLCGVFGVPQPLGILISSPPYSCLTGKRNNRGFCWKGGGSRLGGQGGHRAQSWGRETHSLGQGFLGALTLTRACASCTRVHKHTPPHLHPTNTRTQWPTRMRTHGTLGLRPAWVVCVRTALSLGGSPRCGTFPLHVSPSCHVA